MLPDIVSVSAKVLGLRLQGSRVLGAQFQVFGLNPR